MFVLEDIRAGLEHASWMARTTSGRVMASKSLFPLSSRRMPSKPLSPKVLLVQFVALDHGAHGAIQDEYALLEQVAELCRPRLSV